MNEPRFFHSQQSENGLPSEQTTNINRIKIEIHWEEAVARAKQIRLSHAEAARTARFIRGNLSCWQDRGARVALDTEIEKIFASRPGSRAI